MHRVGLKLEYVWSSRSVMLCTWVPSVRPTTDSTWSICSRTTTARTRSNTGLSLPSALASTLIALVQRFNQFHFFYFRMRRHWLVRWIPQVVWTLTPCCISPSASGPEQYFRCFECVFLCPWIEFKPSPFSRCSRLSHEKPAPSAPKDTRCYILTAFSDAAVAVCHVAVRDGVQRQRLHSCGDGGQSRRPQRVGWEMKW